MAGPVLFLALNGGCGSAGHKGSVGRWHADHLLQMPGPRAEVCGKERKIAPALSLSVSVSVSLSLSLSLSLSQWKVGENVFLKVRASLVLN